MEIKRDTKKGVIVFLIGAILCVILCGIHPDTVEDSFPRAILQMGAMAALIFAIIGGAKAIKSFLDIK